MRQVANYRPKEAAGDDVNVATYFSYAPDGQTAEIRAVNGRTGGQSTKFVYGVDQKSGSALAASHLLREIVYPDSFYANDPAKLPIKLAYNRQGEVIRRTDQNGTVHQYAFDCLGRPVRDTVTVSPPIHIPNEGTTNYQIDATVQAIGWGSSGDTIRN